MASVKWVLIKFHVTSFKVMTSVNESCWGEAFFFVCFFVLPNGSLWYKALLFLWAGAQKLASCGGLSGALLALCPLKPHWCCFWSCAFRLWSFPSSSRAGAWILLDNLLQSFCQAKSVFPLTFRPYWCQAKGMCGLISFHLVPTLHSSCMRAEVLCLILL